jgi:hypothetical protein
MSTGKSECFSEMHRKKKENETILAHIFTRWCDKVTYRMFEESADSKSFQHKLLDVASWRDDDIMYSYKKFLKWLRKREPKKVYKERQLEKIFAEYIVSSLKCICENETIVKSVLTEKALPTIDDIYYKCIRRICRHLYDHPKLFKEKSLDNTYEELFKITKTLLIKFIPLKRLLEEMELYKKVSEGAIYSYSFERGIGDNNENKTENVPTSSKGSTFGSNSTSNLLRYMPSEEFENDYYNPDIEQNFLQDNALGEDQKIKQIALPISQNIRAKLKL